MRADKTSHTCLKALSVKLGKKGIQNLLDKINQITEKVLVMEPAIIPTNP